MKKILKLVCFLLVCTVTLGISGVKVQAEVTDLIVDGSTSSTVHGEKTYKNTSIYGEWTISSNAIVTIEGNLTIGSTGKVTVQQGCTLIVHGNIVIESSSAEDSSSKGELYIEGAVKALGSDDSSEEGSVTSENGSSDVTKKNISNHGIISLDGSKRANLYIDKDKYEINNANVSEESNLGEWWYVDSTTEKKTEGTHIELTYAEGLNLNSFFKEHPSYTQGVFDETVATKIWNVSEKPEQRTVTYRPTADESDAYAALPLQIKIYLLKGNINYPEEYKQLKAVYGQTLSDIQLPAGFAFVEQNQSVGDVGEHEFEINYSNTDKSANYNNTTVTVTVSPASVPTLSAGTTLTATYGQTLKAIQGKYLETEFTFVDSKKNEAVSGTVGNVGTVPQYYNYKDTNKRKNYNNGTVMIKIGKADISNYTGGVLSAVHGQQLKDVSLPAGFVFINPSASVGTVGSHTFEINYSDGSKAKNYNNKKVTVQVKASTGDNLTTEINGLDIAASNLNMNKVNTANQLIALYDSLSASEKSHVPAASMQKLEAMRQLVQKQAKCGSNVYWRYSGGVLTIFGKGSMYNYFNKYNSKTLKKDVAGRSYQSYASAAKTIIVEDGVSKIGRGAFAHFTKVTKVMVKGKNTRCVIGQAAFSCCSKLKAVSLKGVNKIEFSGFSKCSSLTKITLPQGLTALDKSVFLQCRKLKTVSLPTTLKSVGSAVFFDCRKLKTITVRSNIKKCGADVFYYANKKCKVVCGVKAANNCKFVKKAKKAGLKIKKK